MAEYIKREYLLEDIDASMKDSGMGYVIGQILKRYVNRQTPADVAPVRHGNWDSSGKYRFANGELAIRCSECGCSLRQDEYKAYHWNYCPVCGARMDGGVSDA